MLEPLVIRYMQDMQDAVAGVDQAEVLACSSVISGAWRQNRRVFLIGNGGSASTASHLASDLAKRTGGIAARPLRAQSLTDHVELISAIANDIDYSRIFAEQLRVHGGEGDVLVCFSCSGESANIIAGIEEARRLGFRVVGFGGGTGGRMRGSSDYYVHVPSDDYGIIESIHLFLAHLVAEMVVASAHGRLP